MRYSKVLLGILVFLLMQTMAGAMMMGWGWLMTGHLVTSFSPTMTALMTIVSGIASIAIIGVGLKMMALPDTFCVKSVFDSQNQMPDFAAVLGALAGILATNLLSEQFDLPDMLQAEMLSMAGNVLGVISIAVVAPIIEELVFREAIVGYLLRSGVKAKWAILVSALAFGIVHINPAQVPFACLMGIVLAVLYWRTGNIWLCGFVHILNNSLSVIQMNVLGDEAAAFRLTDFVGGTSVAWGCIIGFALLCIMLLWHFCNHYENRE